MQLRTLEVKNRDPKQMAALRNKFLKQAMTYIGIPYAKKYHEPDCVLWSSLKCCDNPPPFLPPSLNCPLQHPHLALSYSWIAVD